MVTVYDVPADRLIKRTAEKLKEEGIVEKPEWIDFVKAGVHKELPPTDPDWWYIRCASLLRRIYIDGPVGVSRLRTYYGGRYRRKGTVPPRFAKGSGSIIREALQQLEKAGLVKKVEGGRAITPKGQSYLDNIAYEIMKELVKERPELSKYC
ncbi:30S ribosomal protein S19e [Methanosarcinales archaeon]|nr:MAG: 30S ribosomal protein S19e [Methanosarcinales archaeon]